MPITLHPDKQTLSDIRRNRFALGFALLAIIFAISLFFTKTAPQAHHLRLTAGDANGRRHELAKILAGLSQSSGLEIEVVPTAGSAAAASAVASHEVDVALIQGGLDPIPGVREVGTLYPEPLHLLVRGELAEGGLVALRGRRVNLSTRGSGTRHLALQALSFVELEPGRDIIEDEMSYADIESAEPEALPDAMFMVSSLPSPVAAFLIQKRGYRLLPLPIGHALNIRDFRIGEATIPAYTYEYVPPVPDGELKTIANHLLLVAHPDVDPNAIAELIDLVYGGEFSRAANLPALRALAADRITEYPLHEGTNLYTRRDEPLLTSEVIDNVESMRSFLVSMAVAAFLFWRWYSRRKSLGFEAFIDEVTRIERRALELEKKPEMDLHELMVVRHRLSEMKNDALEKFARGELKGEEFMSSFLTHVTDVRNYLNMMILHERERIEEEAARGGSTSDGDKRMEALWGEAVGNLDYDEDEQIPGKDW
jgi:TRAP transporter TAXI family solute receptor